MLSDGVGELIVREAESLSTVKQIGRRVKGSEKFWKEGGAEAILQLRADYLSDDQPMDDFWKKRADRMTGQRSYKRRSA